jgi:hypothetical protein
LYIPIRDLGMDIGFVWDEQKYQQVVAVAAAPFF